MKKLLLIVIFLCGQTCAQPNDSRFHLGIMAEEFSVSDFLNRMSNKSIIIRYDFTPSNAIGLQAGVTDAQLANPFRDHDENHFNGKNVYHLDLNYYHFLRHSLQIQFFYHIGPSLIISGSEDYTKNYSNQAKGIPDDYQFTWGACFGIGMAYELTSALSLIVDFNSTYRHRAVYYLQDRVFDYDADYNRIAQDVSAKIIQSKLTSHVRLGLALGF